MKKLHLAFSTTKIKFTQCVKDYSMRFNAQPCLVVKNEYALWRTETLNISLRTGTQTGFRHLGWEDEHATNFTEQTDSNGITWERFNAAGQADEINQIWPQANYKPTNI